MVFETEGITDYKKYMSRGSVGGVNHCRSHCRLAKFDVRGEILRCDWLTRTNRLEIHTGHIQKKSIFE
jgi:hypothetical protein